MGLVKFNEVIKTNQIETVIYLAYIKAQEDARKESKKVGKDEKRKRKRRGPARNRLACKDDI